MEIVFVAIGGGIGATLRYIISQIPTKIEFPILTLLTNILGAMLIGFIAGIASQKDNVSPNTILFWKTGVCGGFTTFSTFSLEAFELFEKNLYLSGGIYMASSVACCILGVVLGKKLVLLAV